MEYSKIGLLAIILHVIVNADIMFRKGGGVKPEVNTKYRLFLYAALYFYASDICWGVFTQLKMITLAYIFAVSFFFSMGLTVFLWIKYIRVFLNRKNIWSNVLFYVSWVLLVMEVLGLICNCFWPHMFYFSPEGEYFTGFGRNAILYVQIVLYSIVGIYTLVLTLRLKDRDKSHHIAVGLSGLLMALFILLQDRYPMTPFYSMGLLIATSIMHTFVMIDDRIENSRMIGSFKRVAYKDPLTGVRNSTAYSEAKTIFDKKLKDGSLTDFAVAVFDLNNLKLVNDTMGHEAGDKYIQDSSNMICGAFKRSPVFRIGGDEFAAFLMNDDFVNRDRIIGHFNRQVENNLENGGPVIAAGMSIFVSGKDTGYDKVFERADVMMYARKNELKQRKTTVTS